MLLVTIYTIQVSLSYDLVVIMGYLARIHSAETNHIPEYKHILLEGGQCRCLVETQ